MKNSKKLTKSNILKKYERFIEKEIKKGLVGHSLTPNFQNRNSTSEDIMVASMTMHQNYLNGNYTPIYPPAYPSNQTSNKRNKK